MKIIDISCWEVLNVEGDWQYSGQARPRERSLVRVAVLNDLCSCDAALLGSQYLAEPQAAVVFGEGASGFDRALELGLSVMCDGETALINIKIPGQFVHEAAEGDVTFTCQLTLQLVTQAKLVFDFTDQEKFEVAVKYKNLGVELYREGTYARQVSAFHMFTQAIKWLAMINTAECTLSLDEVKAMKLQCYNNLGLFHLRRGNHRLSVGATTRVLAEDPANVKALFRRAVANTDLQNYEAAERDLRAAVALDPANASLRKQLDVLRNRQKALDNKYAQAMKKYFM